MNRRRPWHQRLVRKVTRHVPLNVVVKPSPLSLFTAINLLGSLIALLSGIFAVSISLPRRLAPARPSPRMQAPITPGASCVLPLICQSS